MDTSTVIAVRAFPLRRLRQGVGRLLLYKPETVSEVHFGCVVCDLNIGQRHMTADEYHHLLAAGEEMAQRW